MTAQTISVHQIRPFPGSRDCDDDAYENGIIVNVDDDNDNDNDDSEVDGNNCTAVCCISYRL